MMSLFVRMHAASTRSTRTNRQAATISNCQAQPLIKNSFHLQLTVDSALYFIKYAFATVQICVRSCECGYR